MRRLVLVNHVLVALLILLLLPTGIQAACQNERSQMQNRAVAMQILKARLAERLRQEHQQKIEDLRGDRQNIDFGSQIRSYVLHPYQMVKDHRTGVETSDVNRVLDGDLDAFMGAALAQRVGATRENAEA